jgi:2-polyprenyl-6-methoxyphenol hydroxylase-like FAD-dependent oxidoreductase
MGRGLVLIRLWSVTIDVRTARMKTALVTRVAIIGGGIGGLTAANALSRAGTEVAVYEAAAELKEIGAGVALHPNAMKVLSAIGVEASVRKVAGRSQWQVMRNWKTGRVIAKTAGNSRRPRSARTARQYTEPISSTCSLTRCRPEW